MMIVSYSDGRLRDLLQRSPTGAIAQDADRNHHHCHGRCDEAKNANDPELVK
jgi:hypothetical protein